jgi:hypothetical protein
VLVKNTRNIKKDWVNSPFSMETHNMGLDPGLFSMTFFK